MSLLGMRIKIHIKKQTFLKITRRTKRKIWKIIKNIDINKIENKVLPSMQYNIKETSWVNKFILLKMQQEAL